MNFKTKKLLFVIGLPSCGKTSWAYHHPRLSSFQILDDYVRDNRKLGNGGKYCLIDSQFCDPLVFQDELGKIEMDRGKIGIVLFNNDPNPCIKNGMSRKHRSFTETPESRRREIMNLSNVYDIEFYKDIVDIEFMEVPVYST